jgi:5'-3' exonuclease
MHILTIDGSFFAQRILHAEGFTFKTEPEKEKKKFIQKLIISLCNEVNNIGTIDHVIFGLDSRSWRKDFKQVYPLTTTKTEDQQSYKKNREDTERTYDFEQYLEAYNTFVDIIHKQFNVQIVKAKGAEADDIVSIVSQQLSSIQGVYVTAWSSDGDYLQFVSNKISLIKLPQKMLIRPITKAEKVDMFSVFGKKVDDGIIKRLISSFNGNIKYINPIWTTLYKSICGDGKDNVPCIWKWPSSTGTRSFSVTDKHLKKSLEQLQLDFEYIDEQVLYDDSVIRKILEDLMFQTKQHSRLNHYDKKIHKIESIKEALVNKTEDEVFVDAYLTEFESFINHSLRVYKSNLKMKRLSVKEIPEEVVLAILENLRSGSGQTKIVLLESSSTALQTANLQETSSYFDMFALPEDKANKS